MNFLWFDSETYSECDLRTAGTHRYAEHPSTEITVAQFALGDDEPRVLDCTSPGYTLTHEQDALIAYMNNPANIIVAHNSHFDRTILRHCWGVNIPPERWLDTMVVAYAHSLPGALDTVGEVLGLDCDRQKDKRGKELIQLFCKPRPAGHKLRRATRETHPAEWAEFLEYARRDIVAMREVHRKLPVWNHQIGHPEHALWALDQRINDRGFAIDMALVYAAIKETASEKSRLKQQIAEETNGLVMAATQRDALLAYILAEHGVDLPDLKADTLRRRAEDPNLPESVRLLINIRLDATKTSTAKYAALKKATSADGRMRNTMQFGGAQRTLRWSGRIFQPQNLTRPSQEYSAEEYEAIADAIKGGYVDLTGSVMQIASDAVRGCIVAAPGRKLCIADESNIEGRGLVFLSGEQWKLDAFADIDRGQGADMYKQAYARSFNVDPSDVSKGQRQIGKVQELGLGYEGGVGAFLTFAAVYRMNLTEMADAVHRSADKAVIAKAYEMYEWTVEKKRSTFGLDRNVYVACEVLKDLWRRAHPETTAFWRSLKEAAVAATVSQGQVFRAGRHIAFRRDGAWLRMRLPSGRYLCYLQPRVSDDGTLSYLGVNQYTRKWCRLKTYGGKLAENATQAFSRDILAASMQPAEDAGYPIVLSVHDELVTEPEDSDRFSHEELADIMARVPQWATGIPLACAGFTAYRYRKD